MPRLNKILFITLTNVGDAILTLPVIDELRSYLPQAEITVLTGPRPSELFEDNPYIKRTIIYDKHSFLSRKLGLLRMLRNERFDVVVDLRNSLFGLFLPAAYKTSAFLRIPARIKHMRDRHLYRIRDIGKVSGLVKTEILHRSLAHYQTDALYIEKILKENGIRSDEKIVIVSAGARSATKRWPRDKFLELIEALHKEYKSRFILIGDQEDAPVNKYIAGTCKVPILDLSARTTLKQAAVLLKRAAILITNDSANLHLASYLDVPLVAIFGPTDDVKYAPWSSNCRAVKKEIFCRPCRKAQCRFNTLECLQRVSPAEVIRQVRNVLSGANDQSAEFPEPDKYKRILIVRTDRVGDVILTTPVIKALRDAYPGAYLAMAVRPYTKVIVEGNPYLDEVIVYDKDGAQKSWFSALRFSRDLAKKRFDLAIVVNPSNRSNLIPFLAGIPKRVGYDRKLGWLLTDRIKDTKFEGLKHEIEYNLDLVRTLGIEPGDKTTFMPISENSEKWAEAVLSKYNIRPADKLCVLNPGASDNSKMWPAERYAQVAEKLAQKGMKIVILGGPQDQAVCREVIKRLRCPCIDMVANNDISQAASFLRRASLFISSDTGPMHIASSLGVPVIAILGRSQPGLSPLRWGPSNKNSRVVHKDVGCVECLAHCCPKGFLCLQAITAEDVFKAAEELLKNS
jgi:heptosyltransferase II